MAVSSRVVAILGAGPNVGNKVAERFTAAGYKVAVVSRSGKSIPTTIAALSLSADFKNPKIVHGVFEEVRKKLGEPSVVVYNGSRISTSVLLEIASDLRFPASQLMLRALRLQPQMSYLWTSKQDHLSINTTITFAAAQEAVRSFDAINDKDTPRTFIYTGNICNQAAFLPFLTLGVGKAASSHMIALASKSYVDKGYRYV